MDSFSTESCRACSNSILYSIIILSSANQVVLICEFTQLMRRTSTGAVLQTVRCLLPFTTDVRIASINVSFN